MPDQTRTENSGLQLLTKPSASVMQQLHIHTKAIDMKADRLCASGVSFNPFISHSSWRSRGWFLRWLKIKINTDALTLPIEANKIVIMKLVCFYILIKSELHSHNVNRFLDHLFKNNHFPSFSIFNIETLHLKRRQDWSLWLLTTDIWNKNEQKVSLSFEHYLMTSLKCWMIYMPECRYTTLSSR